jgi:hypothetical protein
MLTACQSNNFHPCDHSDLNPVQLAAFYRAVGGNYDALFLETEPPALAFVYEKLGCLHSLQPAPSNDGFAPPRMPALKPRGFTKWQSIQILLMPDEHVPFMQNALLRFDIIDPRTGAAFPKLLPKEAFPSEPDEGLLRWYDEVSNKLRDAGSEPGRFREDAGHIYGDAGYFSNPSFHDRRSAAAAGRGARAAPPRTPVEFLQDRGRAVVSTVRQLWNPRLQAPAAHHVRRRSWHNSDDVDDDGFDDAALRRRASRRERYDARGVYDVDRPVRDGDDAHHNVRAPHNRHPPPRRQHSVGSRTPSPGSRPARRATGYASPRNGRAREGVSPARRGGGDYFSHAGGDVDDADGGAGGYDRPAPPAQQRRSPETAAPTSAAAAAATVTAVAGGFRPSTSAPFAARVAQLADGAGHLRRTGTYSQGSGTHRRNGSGEQQWRRERERERDRDREQHQHQGPRIALPRRESRRRRSGDSSRSRSRSRDSGGLGGPIGVGLREVDRRSRSTDARMLGEGWRRDGAAAGRGGGATGRGGAAAWRGGAVAWREAAEGGEEERERASGSSMERERIRRRERYVEGVDGRRYPERT